MKDNFDIHKWNLERYLNESQESKQTNENQERKQTAVDWLIGQLNKPGFAQVVTDEEIKQAKEIEKEQIIEFANSFYDECGMQYGGLEQSAEEYYQETYGK
jgi:hypothetical protein